MVKKYLLILAVLSSFFFDAFGQKQQSAFWKGYYTYQDMLLKDVAKTKTTIEQKYKLTGPDNDSALLLCNLILFDIYEMYGNTNMIKETGLKLKSQEILFDDYNIKAQISIRYRKTMFYLRDEFSFEYSLPAKITLARQKKNYSYLASIYSIISRTKANLNQRDSAIYYMNVALSNARKQTDKLQLIDIVLDQATIYHQFKNDEISMSKAYLALQMATENNYEYGKYKANLTLAKISSQHENVNEMRLYLLQAKKAALKFNFLRGVQYVDLYEMQSKTTFSKADEERIAAIRGRINEDDSELLAIISATEGRIAFYKKEYPTALQKYNNAIVEFEKYSDLFGIQTVYQLLSDVLIEQKKYDKALTYLEKSRELLNSLNDNAESTYLLKKIAVLYELRGDKSKAYETMKQYVTMKDSLQLIDIQSNLLLLQQQNKTDERERLITLQSDSIKIQQKEKEYTTTMLENIKLKNNLKTYIIIGFVGLILLSGIILFFKWNQNLIQQRQREAEMNQTLLRTQMNPHFVFNAMSVIQSYIYDNDTKNSTKFLVNFSKLMRLILENSSKEFIPMTIEQEILDKYLNVQKLRFEDRFNFDIFTDEELTEEKVMIPPMITQPFIENAIEHGQLHLREDGFINVSFKKVSGQLMEIKVTDNGIGRKKASESSRKSETHKSMAIGITKDRIASLNKKYKTEGRLIFEDFDKENETGTVVTITIPYLHNVV